MGARKDVLAVCGSDPDSSESSSLSESEDDDSSCFFLMSSLGGDLDFGTPLALGGTSRICVEVSDSEELPSSDSDLGGGFLLGFTGGGETDTGECCLFFGGGDKDGDALRPRNGE